MTYWEGPSRWISTILVAIVSFIGLDTLFRLLEANRDNVIVGFVRAVAGVFLAPFADMFGEQQYLLTAVIAVLGWSLLAGLLLAIVRNIMAGRPTRTERRPPEGAPRGDRRPAGPVDGPAAPPAGARTDAPGHGADAESTRRL